MIYYTIGLGSNNGDSSLVFSIEKSNLKIETYFKSNVADIKVSSDTLGKQYYIDQDTIIIKRTIEMPIRTSTIDSIEMYLKLSDCKRVNSNFCVKSGSIHIIKIKSDSITKQNFWLANTFDSTALQITDLIFNYLPQNIIDFRPLDLWELDKRCEEGFYLRKTHQQKNDIPEDRMKLIEKTNRESLEIKN